MVADPIIHEENLAHFYIVGRVTGGTGSAAGVTLLVKAGW